MQEGRDFWWDEEAEKVQSYCPCEPVNSEDPLFILYVSPFLLYVPSLSAPSHFLWTSPTPYQSFTPTRLSAALDAPTFGGRLL
jgi:hypothetical protein